MEGAAWPEQWPCLGGWAHLAAWRWEHLSRRLAMMCFLGLWGWCRQEKSGSKGANGKHPGHLGDSGHPGDVDLDSIGYSTVGWKHFTVKCLLGKAPSVLGQPPWVSSADQLWALETLLWVCFSWVCLSFLLSRCGGPESKFKESSWTVLIRVL